MRTTKLHVERIDLHSRHTELFTKDYEIGDKVTWLGHDFVFGYMHGEEYICTKEHFDLKGDHPVYKKIGKVHISKIKGGNDLIEIYDERNIIHKIPTILRKVFLKTYYQQGLVYLDDDKPCYCSSIVKWLDNVCVETTSSKQADKLMFEFFNYKYPQYNPYVQLF